MTDALRCFSTARWWPANHADEREIFSEIVTGRHLEFLSTDFLFDQPHVTA